MSRRSSAYNHSVVHIPYSSRLRKIRRLTVCAGLGQAIASSLTTASCAQTAAQAGPTAGGRILLVLPFDNRTGQPSLEWIREAAPELISSRFRSVGFEPMSRADQIGRAHV